MAQIGTYSDSNPQPIVAEDAGRNLIYKIEIDEALAEHFIVELTWAGTAINPDNYTIEPQVPAVPAGVDLPTPTPTTLSIVIPAGELFVEVRVTQKIIAPRPIANAGIIAKIEESDRYQIDPSKDTATGYISPRVGRYYYVITFPGGGNCPPADRVGYTLTSSGAQINSGIVYTYKDRQNGKFMGTFYEYSGGAGSYCTVVDRSTPNYAPISNGIEERDIFSGASVWYPVRSLINVTNLNLAREAFWFCTELVTEYSYVERTTCTYTEN